MPIAIIRYLLYLLKVYLLPLAIHAPLDFYHIGCMASLVRFLQMMPITLYEIGLKESVNAMLLGLEARSSESAYLSTSYFSPDACHLGFRGCCKFFQGD